MVGGEEHAGIGLIKVRLFKRPGVRRDILDLIFGTLGHVELKTPEWRHPEAGPFVPSRINDLETWTLLGPGIQIGPKMSGDTTHTRLGSQYLLSI